MARIRSVWPTLLVAFLAGLAGVAGSYAVAGFTPSFVAGPIAGAMARTLPGELITFAIVVLGDLGDQLNVLTAGGIAVLLLGAIALVGVAIGRRLDAPPVGILLATTGGIVLSFAVTGAPLPSAVTGLSMGIVLAAADVFADRADVVPVSRERRTVLGGAATALGVTVAGFVLGRRGGVYRTGEEPIPLVVDSQTTAEVDSLLAEADEQSLDVPGIEPLVSERFYQVDINATDPVVDESDWTLTVTGAVEAEVEYTYEDIRAMEPANRFVSLRCVGEPLNGQKLDNALWTGVPILDLVEPAVPAETCCVMLRAADGFFEEFPLAALEDGFLAYGMNGNRLPRGHGFPARALIPGHWGEINVKWLTEIEVLETEQDGYWEQRGWHGTGPVETVAKLHAVNHLEDGRIQVGGHAYAGTRGIERVEVSTDGGSTWRDAELSQRLPGDDVWRQWSFTYEPPTGSHEVVVRATDANGRVQPGDYRGSFPSGPSGWVSRTVSP